jgi:DNA-binding CsgD family transcriptional regulator
LEGLDRFTRAVAIYEELGDQHFVARTLIQVGYARLATREPPLAVVPIRRAMDIVADLGDAWGIAEGLEAVATARSAEDPRAAVILASAAMRLRERISMLPHPADARINRAHLGVARDRLGDRAYHEAWRTGRELTPAAAIELARSARVFGWGTRRRADRPVAGWESLTPAERVVADLVAAGLSNAAVGERIFVSRHTVDSHLRHIFAKLELRSRVELAAVVARQQG